MRFLYTRYYYPLKEPIPLSHHLGFYLDNPRTKQEITDVSELLLRLSDGDASYFPFITKSTDDIDSIESYLFRFRDKFIELDKYVRKQFASYKREKVIEFIARMVVIARYPETASCQTLVKKYRRVREKELKEIISLPGEYPEITNNDRLEDFGHLLSLLIHSSEDTYWGQTVLLRDRFKVIDDDLWFNFIIFSNASSHFSNGHLDMLNDWQWLFLPSIKEKLATACEALDIAFARGDIEELLYIGNILKIAGEVHDTKVKLLLLTSILELMLTHNPDFNRFNVEDSINKQFQLKMGVLMHMNDSSIDLANLKLQLKEIYQARSNIAHGSFDGLAKMIKATHKKKGGSEYLLETYVNSLYQFVRIAVGAYLKDKNFVAFLKES